MILTLQSLKSDKNSWRSTNPKIKCRFHEKQIWAILGGQFRKETGGKLIENFEHWFNIENHSKY